VALVPLLAGCGAARQDAGEPEGSYSVQIQSASFPKLQVIARPAVMRLVVHNSGVKTAPSVAVSVDSFSYAAKNPELAARQRPIWVIERGPGKTARPPVESQEVSVPGSGQTAYVNTWSLGPLPGGATRAYTWIVTPVKSGVYVVHYRVAPGIAGKATVRATSARSARGTFVAAISKAPPQTYVDPKTGKVTVGPAPQTP
jgi:hypothetical protein